MTTFRYRLRAPTGPISIADYRRRAGRRVPSMAWAYLDGAAEDSVTERANRRAFERWSFVQRVLSGAASIDLTTEIPGATLSFPVLAAPTGLSGLAHWTGELGIAQGAERVGTKAIVSTAATYSIEEVAAGTCDDHIFQLYPWTDAATSSKQMAESLMTRAQNAGYRALVLTVDSPAMGNREDERRHGMGLPPVLTPQRMFNAALRPRWCYGFLRHRRVSARNLVDAGGSRAAVASVLKQYRFMRPELTWSDFDWVRENWHGPLFVKGICHPDDADMAVRLGADGVIVSNHGGRQLDGAMATLDALPAVAAAVAGRATILLDGGVRRGTDVVKALCLGATAVCVGRPSLYGLACGGAGGVEQVFRVLWEEIERTMTLLGVDRLSALDRSRITPSLSSELAMAATEATPHSSVLSEV